MLAASGALSHVWVKDAMRMDNPQYTKILCCSELVHVSDLKIAVLAKFKARWGERAEDDVSLHLVANRGNSTNTKKPNPGEEADALDKALIDSTDSLEDAHITTGCFLLAKCAAVGVTGEFVRTFRHSAHRASVCCTARRSLQSRIAL